MGNDHVVPPKDRLPPQRRVETDMRARLAAGEWRPGEALPSVASLAEHYKTSRATVSKALRRIRDDGLIEIEPAWGTFRTEKPSA